MMYGLTVFGIAFADRFLLRRNTVKIESVSEMHDDKTIRFALNFRAKRAFLSGKLSYSLRNKKHPTSVVTHSRLLDFSHNGLNSEFLTFDVIQLQQESGEPVRGQSWELHIKIERSCSRWNPLYKIFPTVTYHKEEFNIE
ncbi:hypothetical protein [Vibrio fluvialis]|uniref:hypothetical protein n=1 Tax=Vibrio fluvialis TaxID=676 RepID=UPI001EEC84AB|nr:hypothetical protein [Vibrio fluvialis]MCG6387483.1 hypothetical protein [Vibrio fluvialis]